MEEQIISFKTAKLAKEKGFDWNCRFLYLNEQDGWIEDKGVDYNYNTFNSWSAPTQSLLQKWLRKNGVDITIETTSMTREYWSFIPSFIHGNWGSKQFPTYEEALEAALQEALIHL